MRKQSLKLHAPGKINRFLAVTGRRPDGYHQLHTAFQFLALGDELRLQSQPGGQLRLHSPDIGAGEQNLCLRAARVLQSYCDSRLGAEIQLLKRLPIGGGLGGGSSNAAAVLLGLNRLWDCRLSRSELAALGRLLGADVPLFVYGHAALAKGVGDALLPQEFPEQTLLLIYPCACDTRRVFAALELTSEAKPPTIEGRSAVPDNGHNDCEATVVALYPPVAQALAWARRHGSAWLTGTGGCVVLPLPDDKTAQVLSGQLPDGWCSWVTRTVNRSPLSVLLPGAAERDPSGCRK